MSAVSLKEARGAYERAVRALELFAELRPKLERVARGGRRRYLPAVASRLLREIEMVRHHASNLHCFEADRASGEVNARGETRLEVCIHNLEAKWAADEAERQRRAAQPLAKVIPLFGRVPS